MYTDCRFLTFFADVSLVRNRQTTHIKTNIRCNIKSSNEQLLEWLEDELIDLDNEINDPNLIPETEQIEGDEISL